MLKTTTFSDGEPPASLTSFGLRPVPPSEKDGNSHTSQEENTNKKSRENNTHSSGFPHQKKKEEALTLHRKTINYEKGLNEYERHKLTIVGFPHQKNSRKLAHTT